MWHTETAVGAFADGTAAVYPYPKKKNTKKNAVFLSMSPIRILPNPAKQTQHILPSDL